MNFLTVPLAAGHKKNVFACGQSLLDHYIHTQAKQDVLKRISACFVLAAGDKTLKGYYTLSSAAIQRDSLPEEIIKRLSPSYSNLPVTLLGRLAVDIKYQGQGLGELILIDALKRCYEASTTIGSMAVIVDPIDNAAKIFYTKYGFILLPDSKKMFLPMKTISLLFADK
jgi:predicted GNAT family N-acyltransferase